MQWSVHSLKLHELFMYWHPMWHSSTSSKQLLTNWIVQRSYKQSFPLHCQRKIFVTLSSSNLPTDYLRKSQNLNGKSLLNSATSEATLTQPGHSLSQNRLLLPDMKDCSNNLTLDDALYSMKRNQSDVSLDPTTSADEFPKKLKMEETNFKNFPISAFAMMQQQPINPSTSQHVIVPSQDDSDIINHDFYQLECKAERIASDIRSIRVWDMTSVGQKTDTNPGSSHSSTCHWKKLDFKLMSYNILAQELLEQNSYLYHQCDDRVLYWNYRCNNLLREMIESNTDILCLQEMQYDHYQQFFRPEMEEKGYDSIYKKRTGDKNDGCAIFYRKSAFSLELCKEVEFNQPSVSLLDRDNIALIAVFRPILESGKVCDKDDDPKLCVATTHLLFNPRRGDIKLAQLQIVLAELDKIAFKKFSPSTNKPVYHPTILCGDMNSEPHSPLYKFVTRGRLNYYGLQIGDVSGQHEGVSRGKKMGLNEIELSPLGITTESQYEGIRMNRQTESQTTDDKTKIDEPAKHNDKIEELSHSFHLQSAYKHHDSNGMPYISTHHAKANCTVDYIFYSNQKKCSSPKHQKEASHSPKRGGNGNDPLTLLGTYRLLSYFHTDLVGVLPNAVQSSDHISLIAKFRLEVASR